MFIANVEIIQPDDETYFLVGPDGKLVWFYDAFDAYIIAARNDAERNRADAFIGQLLKIGLVPFGMPLNQRATVAMFGGRWTRDCRWVPHTDAPPPTDAPDGDPLPEKVCVIK